MQLFISYSRDDKNYVYELADALRNELAHDLWIDQQLVAAQLWWDTILDRIEWCECFVMILTPKSVSSIYCLAELEYALALNKPIMPLMLKPCDLLYNLRSIHFTDISNLNLERTLLRCSQAIHQVDIRRREGKYTLPPIAPARPAVPKPKTNEPEDAFEVFALAEEAAAEGHIVEAEKLLQQVIKADPDGLGITATERLVAIRQGQDRGKAYVNVLRLARNPATREGAKTLWRSFVKRYGDNYDPESLADLLEAEIQIIPRSLASAEIVRPKIETVSTPTKEVAPPIPPMLPPPFDWCEIPAGNIIFKQRSVRQTFYVPTFYMSKYPITNAQYQVFAAAKVGYANTLWWDYSPHAQNRRRKNTKAISTPHEGDDLPRTYVTWYEAVAFCRWLSQQLGQNISLPTEQQWQRAAQGDDERKYPWGNKLYKNRYNISENLIGEPTSVTAYPNGASPYGVYDMVGNVWEWCLNEFESLKVVMDSDVARGLRGGSFLDPDPKPCAFRFHLKPSFVREYVGFRVVCAAVPT